MLTNGQFLRQCLVSTGSKGVVFADTFRQRKENDVIYHKGTYASYIKLLDTLKRLKWIEKTGEVELAHAKGNGYKLRQQRTYYRITSDGLSRPEEDWSNPLRILYRKSS